MKQPQLPSGIAPTDHFLAQQTLAVTVLHMSADGSTQGLVSLTLGVTEARDPDGKRITLRPVRMSPAQARTLAEALTSFASQAEGHSTAPPTTPPH